MHIYICIYGYKYIAHITMQKNCPGMMYIYCSVPSTECYLNTGKVSYKKKTHLKTTV